ncbi:MAG TPA: MFS transporter [Mycobacteriales bacterium]|nr:MFS transporter [Mycobacteriales bacterium]
MTREFRDRRPVIARPWLTPNLKVLSGVSLTQDAASELLYPVMPIFLTVTLGAPAAVVGAVEGFAEGVAALTKLVAGRLSDRMARKPLIALGYGLAAVGKLLVAVATAWPVVLLGRGVDRVGKGIRGAPRDALLMVDADPATRGRVFGFHRAADTLGAVIGPALGLLLFWALDESIRPLLLVAVVPAVLSVLLVALVREGSRIDTAPVVVSPLPRPVKRLVLVLGLFSLVNFPDALLLLRAHELGLSTYGVIAAYLVYNAVYAGLAFPAGALSDRLPRHLVYAVGLLFFAVGYLGLGLVEKGWLVFLILPLYGGFAAFTDGVGKAWVASVAPKELQGSAQGLFQGVTGGAILVAGVWAGLAWGGDGRLPLLVSGAVGLVAAAVIAVRGQALTQAT